MRSTRFRRLALGLLLGVSLAGCVWHPDSQAGDVALTAYPPAGAAHRVASPAIELFWSCSRPDTNTVRVEGWAINRWYTMEVRDLRLELVGVGADSGNSSAQAVAAMLSPMRSAPFLLDITAAGSETRFDLYYEYRFQEPGDDTFDTSRAPASLSPGILVAASQPWLIVQVPSRFLVWNVCDESLHRIK